jgi:hypothetical protein
MNLYFCKYCGNKADNDWDNICKKCRKGKSCQKQQGCGKTIIGDESTGTISCGDAVGRWKSGKSGKPEFIYSDNEFFLCPSCQKQEKK